MPFKCRCALLLLLMSPTVATAAGTPIAAPRTVVQLPNGVIGRQYDRPIVAGGGQPPYTIVVGKGLPPGLAVLTNGRLVGVPTAIGTFELQIVVRDAGVPPKAASQNYRLEISASRVSP